MTNSDSVLEYSIKYTDVVSIDTYLIFKYVTAHSPGMLVVGRNTRHLKSPCTQSRPFCRASAPFPSVLDPAASRA